MNLGGGQGPVVDSYFIDAAAEVLGTNAALPAADPEIILRRIRVDNISAAELRMDQHSIGVRLNRGAIVSDRNVCPDIYRWHITREHPIPAWITVGDCPRNLAIVNTNLVFALFVHDRVRARSVRTRFSRAYALSGRKALAESVIRKLEQLAKDHFVSPYDRALIHLSLSEREQALIWLERAYEERCMDLAMLKVDQRFDCLRNEPRFETLMERLNFPE